MTKRSRQSPKMRKALRSAAAKKGWEKRRRAKLREIMGRPPVAESPCVVASKTWWDAVMAEPDPDPNPWPRMAAKVRGWLLGWFR